MKPTLLLPLLLVACTPGVGEYQETLDGYASSAFEGNLASTLQGAALHQAVQSRSLLSELGWTQVGQSRFVDTRVTQPDTVISCLDVSEVSFLDAAGNAVSLERQQDRILMELQFSKSSPPLVTNMQEVGEC